MSNIYLVIANVAVFACITAVNSLIVYVSNINICFLVSIPEHVYYDYEIKKLRDDYKKIVIASGLLAAFMTLLTYFTDNQPVTYFTMNAGLTLIMAISVLFYMAQSNKLRQIKNEKEEEWMLESKESALTDYSYRKPDPQENFFKHNIKVFIPHFALCIISFLIIPFFYNQVPQNMVIQTNILGDPVKWGDKNIYIFLGMPSLQLLFSGLFMFINYLTSKVRMYVDPSNSVHSETLNRQKKASWSFYNVFTGFLIIVILLIAQLNMFGFIDPIAGLAVTSVLVLIIIIIPIVNFTRSGKK